MRSVLLVGALLTLAGCVQNSSPFVGHWVGRGTAFSDAARHDIELDLKKDGTYTGQNTFFASGETFRGQGTWQQTSPVDAVAIDRSPGEPLLLWLKSQTLTITSRTGAVQLSRRP